MTDKKNIEEIFLHKTKRNRIKSNHSETDEIFLQQNRKTLTQIKRFTRATQDHEVIKDDKNNEQNNND
ncbi:hypothetical protein [Clostridium sp. 001]|uniref:hypothetical protein n=1 Tax=Clostridium sp. 001 TaxID=1970093 RepID=UPI001C2C6272|nr:hypothetical protein [Clostridium sp. 001]QXE19532.1 hypothetical protein B5S50_12255 [Clostridium sp. 001]